MLVFEARGRGSPLIVSANFGQEPFFLDVGSFISRTGEQARSEATGEIYSGEKLEINPCLVSSIACSEIFRLAKAKDNELCANQRAAKEILRSRTSENDIWRLIPTKPKSWFEVALKYPKKGSIHHFGSSYTKIFQEELYCLQKEVIEKIFVTTTLAQPWFTAETARTVFVQEIQMREKKSQSRVNDSVRKYLVTRDIQHELWRAVLRALLELRKGDDDPALKKFNEDPKLQQEIDFDVLAAWESHINALHAKRNDVHVLRSSRFNYKALKISRPHWNQQALANDFAKLLDFRTVSNQ